MAGDTNLQAAQVEDWLLQQNNPRLLKRNVIVGTAGWLEKAEHSVIRIKRHFIGMTLFREALGDTRSSFAYYVGPNQHQWSRIGGNTAYECTQDDIQIDDYIVGEGWQFQTWEHLGDWEKVAGSDYTAPAPGA
jgi:hypothetical protein